MTPENGDNITPPEPIDPGEGRNPADLNTPRDAGGCDNEERLPGEDRVPCPYGLRVNGYEDSITVE